MNREYNEFHDSSKNSERLLKNLKNMTGDYFCRTLYSTVLKNLRLVAMLIVSVIGFFL